MEKGSNSNIVNRKEATKQLGMNGDSVHTIGQPIWMTYEEGEILELHSRHTHGIKERNLKHKVKREDPNYSVVLVRPELQNQESPNEFFTLRYGYFREKPFDWFIRKPDSVLVKTLPKPVQTEKKETGKPDGWAVGVEFVYFNMPCVITYFSKERISIAMLCGQSPHYVISEQESFPLTLVDTQYNLKPSFGTWPKDSLHLWPANVPKYFEDK